MIGAIVGDVIGSLHEGGPSPGKAFELFPPGARFTDDTVLTVAVAWALRTGTAFDEALRAWGRRYPDAGYGGWFAQWLRADAAGPYNSFGNGAAMRVAPVGWAYDDTATVARVAAVSAAVTHDHPEGIKGAQAVAGAIRRLRRGDGKRVVVDWLAATYGYDCHTPLEEQQRRGGFDVTCQGTVPAAVVAFRAASDFEDAVRNAVSFGGDTDTLACITGALAEAHFGGVPQALQSEALARLQPPLLAEARAFAEAYGVPIIATGASNPQAH